MRVMRRRITHVAVTAVVVALALFVVPLGVVVRNALFNEERLELERAALHTAISIGPDFAAGDPIDLPEDRTRTIGVYDRSLRLRTGRGPTAGDDVVHRAAHGAVADTTAAHTLVLAIPITSSETVVGVVRAAVPTSITWSHVLLAWLALAGLAAAALTVAVLVARQQGRLLSAPLEQLSAISQRVADGDLTARSQPSRIPEIDQVGDTQNTMVDRLTDLLQRERTFSAGASHQLRTPLTGLQLGLDRARDQAEHPGYDPRPALADASRQVDQLHATIDDLLQITRAGSGSWPSTDTTPLGAVLTDAEQRWHGPLAERGRHLTVHLDRDVTTAPVPGRAVVQILNVLIDNALRHGAGSVTLSGRGIGDTTAIDVADEGSIDADPASLFLRRRHNGAGHGIGLPLAQSIAEACGGRLRLAAPTPTTFSLLFPEPTGQPPAVFHE